AIIGPHDYVPSRLGRTLLDYAHGRLRAYAPGGFEFVNVGDLVEGHLLAMERGRPGQRYLLSTEYLTVDRLLGLFAEVTGRARRPLRIPGPVLEGAAVTTDACVRLLRLRTEQRFTPAAVRFLRMGRRADIGKARRELGYRPTTIAEAVAAAHACFGRRGLLR
ncbi:MAG TPA: hypothetical protein VHJ17_25510, partial [Thermomonospora sp.]|nr:hypothetical protein [Thermomonospora sp.]